MPRIQCQQVWMGDNCGVLDILSNRFDPNRNDIHKYILERDGNFNLPFLTDFVSKYITLNSSAAQDDVMLYKCIISSLSSDGLFKVSNCSEDYYWGDWESGVLIIKVVLDESGL